MRHLGPLGGADSQHGTQGPSRHPAIRPGPRGPGLLAAPGHEAYLQISAPPGHEAPRHALPRYSAAGAVWHVLPSPFFTKGNAERQGAGWEREELGGPEYARGTDVETDIGKLLMEASRKVTQASSSTKSVGDRRDLNPCTPSRLPNPLNRFSLSLGLLQVWLAQRVTPVYEYLQITITHAGAPQ